MANYDNPRTGADFEAAAEAFFHQRGVRLRSDFFQPVGVRSEKRPHKFDLGSDDPPLLIECKCHTWTSGGNAPSAKLSAWIRLVEADGWRLVVTEGSHRQFKHPSKTGRVTVSGHPGDDMPKGTLASILRQASLKRGRR